MSQPPATVEPAQKARFAVKATQHAWQWTYSNITAEEAQAIADVLTAHDGERWIAEPADSPVDPETWPCTWLIQGYGEDGPTYYECGATSRYRPDDSGYDCDAGHEHTYAEARQAQGWDYASDAGEAAQLAKAGVEPRERDGHIWPA